MFVSLQHKKKKKMEDSRKFIPRTDEEIRAGLMATLEHHRRMMRRLKVYAEQRAARKEAVAI